MLKGNIVALITPFNMDGSVNYSKLETLVEYHCFKGTDALLLLGTTSESPTLSDSEKEEIIRCVINQNKKRLKIVIGVSENKTQNAVINAIKYEKMGADYLLVLTPFYNKCNKEGLYLHYCCVAGCVKIPIILYNVPTRTGVNIEPSTYRALMNHENIIAIKEANGNISKIVETMSYCCNSLDMYSGNDDQIVPIMSLGGKGVISVVSNILPAKTVELCNKALKGDFAGAAKLQYDLHAIIDSLFCEVNPIPVKAATAAMGFGTNTLRLPLTPMSEDKYQNMLKLMREQGLNV